MKIVSWLAFIAGLAAVLYELALPHDKFGAIVALLIALVARVNLVEIALTEISSAAFHTLYAAQSVVYEAVTNNAEEVGESDDSGAGE